MEPVLHAGDFVIVDLTAAQSGFQNGLWMIRVGLEEHIKQVEMVGPDQFHAKSANKDYPTVDLTGSKWELVGRLVYRHGKI
jgi:phage repressor protein C with HTH and peptisase S24 domain